MAEDAEGSHAPRLGAPAEEGCASPAACSYHSGSTGLMVACPLKVAVAATSLPSVREQVGALPEQAPPQPRKVEPGTGVALSSTSVPAT